MTALFTADAPRWFVLVLIGLGMALYGACGLLTLVGRARARRRRPLRPAAVPHELPPARGLVITIPAPEEVIR